MFDHFGITINIYGDLIQFNQFDSHQFKTKLHHQLCNSLTLSFHNYDDVIEIQKVTNGPNLGRTASQCTEKCLDFSRFGYYFFDNSVER